MDGWGANSLFARLFALIRASISQSARRVTSSVRSSFVACAHFFVVTQLERCSDPRLNCVPRNGNALIPGRCEDEFHELNYYNGRGASSRELYDSQHSRIVPLASRLLGLSFPPPSLARTSLAPAQDTSPSSIHYARTNAVFIQRSPRRIHVSRPHLRDTKPTGIVLYGDII